MRTAQLRKELDGLVATVKSQIAGALKVHSDTAERALLLADLRARAQTFAQVRVMIDRAAARSVRYRDGSPGYDHACGYHD